MANVSVTKEYDVNPEELWSKVKAFNETLKNCGVRSKHLTRCINSYLQ